MAYRIISIILPFLIRTAILYVMGEEYVGLGSLFTSILQVLNLAELGFSSAIIFNMYEPISKNDVEEVCSLLSYYRKVYRIIGTVIGVIGIMLLPFIPFIIKGDWPSDINIYLLFCIYLFNTVCSYFLYAYKSALLNAAQRIDLVNIVQLVTNVLIYSIQLLIIIFFRNYYLFVTIQICGTICSNLLTAYLAKKKYPQYICKGKISEETKENVKKQVGGVMLGKLSDTSRNSFDSVVISSYLGLAFVAAYSNYFYIVNALYGIMLVLAYALQASVGNSIIENSKEKNYKDLLTIQFIFNWIIVCSLAFLLGFYQWFIYVWAGEKLMLSNETMIMFCLYYYVLNINNSRNLYFSGSGLWWKAKFTFILEALTNLLLNFVLGKWLGILGVLLASVISLIVFNYIARTNILFEQYFESSPYVFYKKQSKYLLTGFGILICTYILCELIHEISVRGLLIRGVMCLLIPNALLIITSRKTEEFRNTYMLLLRMIKKT